MTALCASPQVDVVLRQPLLTAWEMTSATDARSPDRLNDLHFIPAQVPGTAASDDAEYWFRCRFDAEPAGPDEEMILELEGLATLSEVWLNGRHILRSVSMFASHRLDVSELLNRDNELLIVCRSLSAALRAKRGQAPRSRWRTRVVAEQQLRWFRTTLLGRAPGFAQGPVLVGPWRPVTLLRRRHIVIEHCLLQTEFDGAIGILRVELRVQPLRADNQPRSGSVWAGKWNAPITWEGQLGQAVVRIPNVARWWPHTHGEPVLYPLRAELELADGSVVVFEDTPIGFRSLAFETGLAVNGVPVFCRGVVWTPVDTNLRQRLELLRDAGFNLIRLAGTTVYETDAFHRLCDELGILVWQDMMFANMDYPFADAGFSDLARSEAECHLSRLARHTSSAVICGNSEIEQQARMLGLEATASDTPFFREELPRIAAQCCPGVPWIPSAPSGGDLPFHTRTGVTNYFGVGAYLRPLDDVRRSEVRFASECLAFSNVPEPEVTAKMALSPTHPVWKRGVPRDSGAGWDFEDVRDHYLNLLYSLDPLALRRDDTRRYWELSRMVSGEVMAEVFGEWRRAGSPCGGGIVLWSADLTPGAGWGILDSDGFPKSAYWFLKRALAPCTVWTTDEGLNGIDVHAANDGPAVLDAWLRVALYANGERKIAESERAVTIHAHGSVAFGLEQMLGRFVDASYAYRFGPPGHDLISASLHLKPGDCAFARSFRFPAGRSAQRIPISELGITAQSHSHPDGSLEILVNARRFANGVRVTAPNALPDDCYFGIEPGGTHRVVLAPMVRGEPPTGVALTAINADGRIRIATGGAA